MGDISVKDEFVNVKNISVQDIFNVYCFLVGLVGQILENVVGLGDLEKVWNMY